jgi:chemotaxis protein CheX
MSINQAVIEQLKMSEEELADLMIADMRKIFSSMAGIENFSNNPRLIDPINVFNDCVTALVGLAGAYCGLVTLHLPDILAKDITSKMLDIPITEVNRNVHDTIGELVMMIAGSFKLHLEKNDIRISLSIPSTFTAGEYHFSANAHDESLAILCDVGDQWFMVSLTLMQPQD